MTRGPRAKTGIEISDDDNDAIGGLVIGRASSIRCRQPRCLRAPLTLKTGGFASPPHGGFALVSIRAAGAGHAAQRKIYKSPRRGQTCPERETEIARMDADSRRHAKANMRAPTCCRACQERAVRTCYRRSSAASGGARRNHGSSVRVSFIEEFASAANLLSGP